MTVKVKGYKSERQLLQELKKKNTTSFWLDFTKYFRPWLYELTKKYKERGNFPVSVIWLLPSYYNVSEDIEIAAFASLLIKDDENLVERISAFRQMFGDSPFDWFRTRGFVKLSVGDVQNKRTGGVLNKDIASLFSDIYDNWGNRQSAISIILLKHFGNKSYWNKLHTLRLVLGTSDGIGLGVWHNCPYKMRCPLTGDVMALLRTFFQDYNLVGSADEVLRLFGFKNESDVYYAALAYKELQVKQPKECSRLATLYQKWYMSGTLRTERYWIGSDRILPEI